MKKDKKKKIFGLIIFLFAIFGFFQSVSEVRAQAVTAHVRIVGTTRTIWFGDVTTEGCTITDTDLNTHDFSEPVALCALDAASILGNFDYTVKDFGGSLGLFLESIAEDKPASDFSTFWLYDVNNQPATTGAGNYIVNNSDNLLFHFENPNADLNLRAINDGISFLKSQQQDNGQISGFSGITSWAIMSFAAAGINPDSVSKNGNSLTDYISENTPLSDAAATDWERNLLATTASGNNPYSFNGINYVQKLESYSNNSQIGSLTQLNDDIFGVLALVSAGSGAENIILLDSLEFILSHQQDDGGFSWSTTGTSDTDTTAAALQAIVAAKNAGIANTGLDEAISKAKDYINGIQNSDGGFPYAKGDTSNTSTTAWALMALSSANESGESINKAKTFIRNHQEENGSFKWQPTSNGETFTTSYAVLSLTGKYWPVDIFEIAATSTPTMTPTPTLTITPTNMPIPTMTPTLTPSPTLTLTPTVTITPTVALTPTKTASPTPPTGGSPSLTPPFSQRTRFRNGYFLRRQEWIMKIRKNQEKIRKMLRRELDRLFKPLEFMR